MTTKKRITTWTFESAVKSARIALRENRSLSKEIAFYQSLPLDESPQVHCSQLGNTIGVERNFELLCLLAHYASTEPIPDDVWRRLHIVWRYEAFNAFVYIERLEQLVRENPGKSVRRMRIAEPSALTMSEFLMTLALSVVIGEERAAEWLWNKCLYYFEMPLPYVKADTFTLGPIAPFLLKLYGLYRGFHVDLEAKGVKILKPFQDIFDAWDKPQLLEDAVRKLCELHAWKVVNYDLADNDLIFGVQVGVHQEFPSEILLIQRIRQDLGLSVPNPDHPILRSPLMKMPFPCPKSGYDPWLAASLEKVRRYMPELRIEWEEEFQRLGPSDPRRLPDTDFPVNDM